MTNVFGLVLSQPLTGHSESTRSESQRSVQFSSRRQLNMTGWGGRAHVSMTFLALLHCW